jgi:hypothetical protein
MGMFAVVTSFSSQHVVSSAMSGVRNITSLAFERIHLQEGVSNIQLPRPTQAPRINLIVNEVRDVPVAVSITSVVVVSPEIASAQVKNSNRLTIIALHVGETIVIAFDGQTRYTFLVQVVGRTYLTTQPKAPRTGREAAIQGGFAGSYTLSYSTSFADGPSLIRQSFGFRRKLLRGSTARFSSEMFRFVGQGNRGRARATTPGFALDRISLGMDSTDAAIDLLDSQINISPLSFENYAMRGFHFLSTPNSRLRGLEVFAGQAHPSLFLFDKEQGRLAGLQWPVAQGRSGRVRIGFVTVAPQQSKNWGTGGTIWQIDAQYIAHENIEAEGEAAYAHGRLSWRTRVELRYGIVSLAGEIVRLDRRSPLISIGAQPGGRRTETFGFRWRPGTDFNASFSYNRISIAPPATAARIRLDRTTLFASSSYRTSPNSRVGFRYTQQQIETGTPLITSRFRLETRSATLSHDIRLNRSLTNNLEARLNSSREIRVNAETERGMNLNDQLHFSWRGGSASGFVNYTRRTPSLTGLIIRNPQLLPPLFQHAFAADPVLFLQTNRDALGTLLSEVELPLTRGLDVGLRLQTAFSRISLGGEVRYASGEIMARKQRNVLASVSVNMRLDEANSVQLMGSRFFAFDAVGRQSGFTIGYVHRFGAGSGEGFQFSRLLGLDRGLIQGRAFSDLNGNGHDDLGEPGIVGMRVQIDGDRSTKTDEQGRFRFQMKPGEYNIAIISDDLGVRLRASTLTQQQVSLSARQTLNLSFGVSDFGSVAGQVFNDLSSIGEREVANAPGVASVTVSLRRIGTTGAARSVTVDASGVYQFHNIAPGEYVLEIDAMTLPANFRLPSRTSWPVIVRPLENFYVDIPLVAQRAIAGVVFIDKDGDGKFDSTKDQPIEGARVMAAQSEVITGITGTYLLRNLPMGKTDVRACTPSGAESVPLTIDLPAEPATRRAVNLEVRH